jgi:acyl-CoA synthetase (AMP-forming)/AMP-acid ligase II
MVLIPLLVAVDDLGRDATLLRSDMWRPEDPLNPVGCDSMVRACVDGTLDVQEARHGGRWDDAREEGGTVVVFSSGTLGVPRARRWVVGKLLEAIRVPNHVMGGTWLSAYPLDTFAGLQALLYACAGAESLVLLESRADIDVLMTDREDFRLAVGTPTFWRRALLNSYGVLSGLHIGTISMGGEPATQELLSRLRVIFPDTRLVHVYATSQHGSILSVSDGLEGFPASWLGRRSRSGSIVTVVAGELQVEIAQRRGFEQTGDLVRVYNGRVFFDGRADEQINVAGQKISPVRIERALRSLKGVGDARVFGWPNPVTGAVIAAEIVPQPQSTIEDIRKVIVTYFNEFHAREERPRRITFVSSLATTHAGKLARQS